MVDVARDARWGRYGRSSMNLFRSKIAAARINWLSRKDLSQKNTILALCKTF
jgi:hypothetical protein